MEYQSFEELAAAICPDYTDATSTSQPIYENVKYPDGSTGIRQIGEAVTVTFRRGENFKDTFDGPVGTYIR